LEANRKLQEEKREFKQWLITTVKVAQAHINEQGVLTEFLDTTFVPKTETFWQKLFQTGGMFPFEEAYRKHLRRSLIRYITPRIFDYTAKRKLSFGNWLIDESAKIEKEFQQIKSGVETGIWNRETKEFFDRLQVDIYNRQRDQLQVTVPGLGLLGVAGLAGAGAVTGVFLAGMISATFATGGGVLFTALALGGIGGAINFTRLWTTEPTTEEEAKKIIFDRYVDQIVQAFAAPSFDDFAEEQLGNWTTTIQQVEEALGLNLLAIQSLSASPTALSLKYTYEKLCTYLKFREDVMSHALSLRDCLQTVQWSVSAMKEIIRQKARIKSHEDCFVCQTKIKRCNHLCSSCDVLIKCPYCTIPTFIVARIEGQQDNDLEALLNKFIQQESIDPEALSPEILHLHQLLDSRIGAFSELINAFTDYWMKKHEDIAKQLEKRRARSRNKKPPSASTAIALEETRRHC